MYSLDLKTLISILQIHAQTGLLHATLPKGIVEHATTASATITVVKGELVSCAIKDQDGLPYALGEQAYQLLARMSSLEWTLKLQLASSLLPPPPSLRADVREQVVPRRLREPLVAQHAKWTRTQRLVFAIIDGKKSVGEIARFLSLSPSLVQQALFDLYHRQAEDELQRTRIAVDYLLQTVRGAKQHLHGITYKPTRTMIDVLGAELTSVV